ncbi:MAG: S-layer homology domain-containing protein [Cohnella sp.]|nr:S-layer homology domain-containing protein [Cohnella sp.]
MTTVKMEKKDNDETVLKAVSSPPVAPVVGFSIVGPVGTGGLGGGFGGSGLGGGFGGSGLGGGFGFTGLPFEMPVNFTVTGENGAGASIAAGKGAVQALAADTKVDPELLSLVRVNDNGTVDYLGGVYNPSTQTFKTPISAGGTFTVVEHKVSFGDIADVKQWAGRQIEVAAAKGIVEGRADGAFVPNDKVTRAEFTKMIVKTFGLESATAKENFADVSDADWFKPYVASAVKAGLINGRDESTFAPNDTITRAEMATIASRALIFASKAVKVSAPDAALKGFSDAASINPSLKDGVALAAKSGIVIGDPSGTFNPNADSTRAQAAVVIYRLLNK